MRLRLKFLLPAIQMLLAATLLFLANRRTDYGLLGGYGPPERLVCWAINAPVAFVYGLTTWAQEEMRVTGWIAFNYSIVGPLTFVLAVGVLWYLVGAEIEAHRKTGRGHLPSHRGLRSAADILLVAAGMILGTGVIGLWDPIRRVHDSPGYAVMVAVGYGVWAVMLVAVYGRDLVLLVLHKH